MKIFRRMLLSVAAVCVGFMAGALTVEGLKVQQLTNPSVVDVSEPAFSWHIVSPERGVTQKSYRIVVSSDPDGADIVWDSGTVESDMTQSIAATGIVLQPATRYYWHVTATDNKGHEATSTEQAWFSTGLMGTGWDGARWIKASDVPVGTAPETAKEITDYTVEATFEIEHTAAGICFAAADGNNFYMWQFNVEGAFPRFRPHRWQGGNPECLANVDLRGKKEITANKEYAVRIEVTDGGKRATTYIDDVKVDSRTGSFAYGLVGIRQDKGETDGQPEIAIFDNFKVTTPDGDILFEEDFSSDRPAMDGGGSVVNERLRVVGSVQQSVYAWERTGAAPLHYTVETDMTLMADNAGIVFASTGPRTYLMWQINTFDNATHPIVRHHIYNNALHPQHSDVVVNSFRKTDIIGKEHRIKLDINGKVIKTFIDDVLVDTYTETTGVVDKAGSIGFRVDNSSSFRDNAYFDNVKVTFYGEDGTAQVTLDEDFEHLPSAYFHDAVIENVNGNNKLYMPIRGIETIVLERGSKGEPMFRRDFTVDRDVKSATIFTSGLGIYDLFVNDTRVGHVQPDGSLKYEELKPGRTDYNHRVPYQMHDVTHLLSAGKNAVGAIVTDGWWRGDVAHGAYGNPELAFIAKLVIEYADGTSETIVTDHNWMSSTGGPMRRGDLYEGEIYDARLEAPWCSKDASLAGWNGVEFSNEFKGVIQALASAPIEELKELEILPKGATVFKTPVHTVGNAGMIDITSTADGVSPLTLRKGESVIYDFGQNFAGWVEFTVKGNRGNRVRLRYSEMLNDTGEKSRGNDGPGGSLYLLNLRSAKAQTFYTLAGKEAGETYRPTMTFFGFRYCEISATEDVEILSVKGRPVSTRMADTGSFECSHPDVNRLFSNVVWSQRSNFVGIPTDCPQRDERLGWAADTQIFARTALYNADAATFYHHWMETVRDGQNAEGAFPNVSPWESWDGNGAGAWADAGIVVPWMVYLMHGDTSIIEENYDAMEKYMNWLARQTGDGYQYNGAGTTFGDWLAFVNTDSRYVSVCYYAYDVQLMEKMSRALSKSEGDIYDQKAKKYADLFEKIRAEFKRRYLNGGVPTQATQTGYLLALRFGLLPDDEAVQKTVKRLENAITSNREKLNTGFVGTGVINQTLSENGLDHKAYNLLLQRECPSWLYSVDQGATTTWERWDSYRLDKGFGDYTMNSFNHYAYGAVAEWMYSFMAGIDTDETKAGFKHIILRPTPDNRTSLPTGQVAITHAGATYNSVHGRISSKWIKGDELRYEAEIPANTTATLYLPAETNNDEFFESGRPAAEAEGVTFEGFADGKAVFTLGSGKYSFTRTVNTGLDAPVSATKTVAVYPNPVTDELHILTDTEIRKATIFDTTGVAVMSDASGSTTLNLSALPTGLYILSLETSGTPATVKVIKQ